MRPSFLVFVCAAVVLMFACAGPTPTTADTAVNDPTDLNADADGDGYTARLDCDDADPATHPDATESCDNNEDDDCDGMIDDQDDDCDEVRDT